MTAVEETVPVAVVIPTIGRPQLLRETLEALARCRPRAAEVLVVDQSEGGEIAAITAGFAQAGARHERCPGRGLGRARNHGLRAVGREAIMFIDDDCSVTPEWVGMGYALALRDPACLWTGRVLPLGDPNAVPSTKDDTRPHDFTGSASFGALYPNNMVLPRRSARALGGFDETIVPAAEDCDFCYRWLRAGHPLRYEPALVLYHCQGPARIPTGGQIIPHACRTVTLGSRRPRRAKPVGRAEREAGGAIVEGPSMALVGPARAPALRIGALCGVLRPCRA